MDGQGVGRLAYLSRTTAPAIASVTSARRSPQAIQLAPVSLAAGHPRTAGSPLLAPRLAASYKIAMAITMGYMLIMML